MKPSIESSGYGSSTDGSSPLPHASVNLWKKLHEDEQGFRGKLHKNASWAREFLSASGRQAGAIDVCLILDQPLHLWRQSGDVVVTDYQDLAAKLQEGQITLSTPAIGIA